MTAEELRKHLNDNVITLEYSPETYEVDEETFKNVLLFIFQQGSTFLSSNGFIYVIILTGKNKGIIFKGVELLLKKT